MLFEGRLGGSLYRPIGLEWFERGYWHIYLHPATVQQYLTLSQGFIPKNGTPALNKIGSVEDGVYYCRDIPSGGYNKAITFEKFCEMPIDIIIASLPQHIQPFKHLIKCHKPNAKLIYQIGNAWSVEAGLAPNIMASAIIRGIPPHINFVQYHQEFSTDIFCYKPPVNTKNIYSFINCLNTDRLFRQDWELFLKLEQLMPEWNFKSFGGQCRDGYAKGERGVAEKMHESRFIFHVKKFGDGFGHILHDSAFCGRPPIIRYDDYKDKLGDVLLDDTVTCILIDDLSANEIKDKITYYSRPDRYDQMSRNIYETAKQHCDFDQEEQDLRRFLANLR